MPSTTASARDALIADGSIGGRQLGRALSDATDDLLVGLFDGAAGKVVTRRRKSAVALVAVGGYGRQELAPQSDVDVLLVYDGKPGGIEELAKSLWYPLWDAGLKLGHAVRSLEDQLALAGDDLDTATSLLSARPLAGDDELGARLVTEGRSRWRRNGRRWLDALRSRVIERRTQAGDVAYLLEPDLKDGHGGLRDVHTLWWAADADLIVPADDLGVLDRCYGELFDVRVALHREKGRPGDVLRLEDQDAVAARLGMTSADAMMADVAAAARSIDWIADGAWRHVSRHQLGHEERVGDGLVVIDREVELTARADVGDDPVIVLRAARVAAQRDVGLARPT
ncbi:MAG: nucleotidyltransferase domain-containing protein, partial [Ilumatobacteraceae bacterium]